MARFGKFPANVNALLARRTDDGYFTGDGGRAGEVRPLRP
jgi:hypothetical protein